MIIFLGGSRNLAFVPEEVQLRLDSWIHSGAHFVIGDANGADSALQAFLVNRESREVTVFSSADRVRNNIGHWQEERVESELKGSSADKHTVKDREMVRRATQGLVMWDRKSIGTLVNIIDLVQASKPVLLFDSQTNELQPLESQAEFADWSQAFSSEIKTARKRLKRYQNRLAKNAAESDEEEPDDRLF